MRKLWLASFLLLSAPVLAQEDIPTLEPELKAPSPEPADSDVPDLPPPNPDEATPVTPEPIPEAEPPRPRKPPETRKPRPEGRKPQKRRKKPRPAVERPAKEAPAEAEETLIFGVALKYGFTSLAGSASEDDNSPTLGGSLYLFQAPSPAKDSLGITAGLMLDYEESDVAARDQFAIRLEGKDATLSVVSVDLLVCFFSNWAAKICPFLGYGSASIKGRVGDYSAPAYPYGINIVSGTPRQFSSFGIMAGGQLMLYQPVWDDADAGRKWSASVGSASLYLGVSY